MAEPVIFQRLRDLAEVVRNVRRRVDTLEADETGTVWQSGSLGNGSLASFTITHNRGTRDIGVEVFENSGDYETVIADVARPTLNAITITFASPPTINQYRYVLYAPQ